jgi:protein-tyrosine phosphatase
VVAVHCNHGKGRTGTAIISLMLLINFFKATRDCLHFYNSQRFSKSTYGVDQPCQLRYLNFIEQIIEAPKID